MRYVKRALLLSLTTLLMTGGMYAQAPGHEFSDYLESNDKFGPRLLQQAHISQPDQNIVLSPISLSVVFAALRESTYDTNIRKEYEQVFGSQSRSQLAMPNKVLLGRFEKPRIDPAFEERKRKATGLEKAILSYSPEELWTSNEFSYTGQDRIDPRYMSFAEKYFGLQFKHVLAIEKQPTPDSSDFELISNTHLRTVWKSNLFNLNHSYPADFALLSGTHVQTELMQSELNSYFYTKNENFEAVTLFCESAYMTVVLPAEGKSVMETERLMAERPEIVDSLKPQYGDVALPEFQFNSRTDIRSVLESMGLHQPFHDLGEIIKIRDSHLTKVNQQVSIEVNRIGIRANAETVAKGIYGGIMSTPQPFHMKVNRPFIFLIHDNTTGSILFLGTVMNPTQH